MGTSAEHLRYGNEYYLRIRDVIVTVRDPAAGGGHEPGPDRRCGGLYTVAEGSSITLTASGGDPEGGLLSYAWDLDSSGTFQTPGQNVLFSAAALDGPTVRTAVVRVTDDGDLTASSAATITIVNAAPVVANISLVRNPLRIGAALQATASFSDPGVADTHTGTWTWGDGTAAVAAISPGSVAASHTYTAVGVFPVRVDVTDDDGGVSSSTANATLIYKICALYDPTRVVRSGSTVPIKVQLCDATGANRSSPAIVLHTTGTAQVSAAAPGPLYDTRLVTADTDFRYDATLGDGGGYIFNLSTVGLSTGTYVLKFTAGAEAYEYATGFKVR